MCWSPFSFLAGCFRRLLIPSSLVRFRRTETNAQSLKALLRLLGEEALNRPSLTHPEVAVHNDSGSSQTHRIALNAQTFAVRAFLGALHVPGSSVAWARSRSFPFGELMAGRTNFVETNFAGTNLVRIFSALHRPPCRWRSTPRCARNPGTSRGLSPSSRTPPGSLRAPSARAWKS